MADTAYNGKAPHRSGNRERIYPSYPHQLRAWVMECHHPGCDGEAIRLCNSCGEVFCVEHSTMHRGVRGTAVDYRCAACAEKAEKTANQSLLQRIRRI